MHPFIGKVLSHGKTAMPPGMLARVEYLYPGTYSISCKLLPHTVHCTISDNFITIINRRFSNHTSAINYIWHRMRFSYPEILQQEKKLAEYSARREARYAQNARN